MVELFSQDAEANLLSIILKNPELAFNLLNTKTEMFSSSPNRVLFGAIRSLIEQGLTPEYTLVVNSLQTSSKIATTGGEEYLKYLYELNPDKSNLFEYERLIIECWKTRELLSLVAKVKEEAVNAGNITTVLAGLQNSITNLQVTNGGGSTEFIGDVAKQAYDVIVDRIGKPDNVGTPLGIHEVDVRLGGIKPGEVRVIAARPSVGKTAEMCNGVLNAAKAGAATLVVSKEMTRQAMIERFLAIESGVPLTKIGLGRMSQEEVNSVAESIKVLKGLPIYLDCFFGSDVDYICATARKLKQQYDIKTLRVDYLQLLVERDDSQTSELGRVMRTFKFLANELEIGVVVYSQLNRSCELRDDKRPLLSDLRQSGNIEEDADMVVALYRDDYYNKDTKYPGVLEYLIRKNRNGPTGLIPLKFDLETNRITSSE